MVCVKGEFAHGKIDGDVFLHTFSLLSHNPQLQWRTYVFDEYVCSPFCLIDLTAGGDLFFVFTQTTTK